MPEGQMEEWATEVQGIVLLNANEAKVDAVGVDGGME